MKRIVALCVFVCYAVINVHAQAPTVASSAINYNFVEGNSYRINWTSGNGARRIVVMRQGAAVTAIPVNGVDYNHNNIFGNGDAIQPGQFVIADNASSFVDVSGLQPNTTYHIAIFEYNGTASATQYLTASFGSSSRATLAAPTIQTSAILTTSTTGNSITLNWTNGNGAQRLVVARAATAVNANPVDLTSYSAGPAFTTGTQIGSGNYVVFGGSGNTVTITGLQPSTTYHFAAYEYNGTTGPVYLVPGAITSATTAARPSIAATPTTFIFVEGNSMRLNWTSGNGSRRIVVARAGSAVTAVPADGIDHAANAAFGNGDDLGSNQYVVYDGASSFVDMTNLQAGITYHFRIYEYDGSGASTAYLTSAFGTASQATLSAPATQASAINFTNLSGSTVTVNWTNGSGARRLLIARAGSAVNADPVNYTSYTPGNVFGSGTQLGTGNFVVHGGTGNSVALTNLAINTTYHFALYEYNGSSGPVYLIPGTTGSITTPAAPTVAASNITFNLHDVNALRTNWTSGNGQRRILVGRMGGAVTAVPTDGIDYNASGTFGSGDDLGGNQYILYDGTSSFVDITNLLPGTTYHFRVYEYNGTGVNTAYLTSTFPSGSSATLGVPTVQASAVNVTNIGGSVARINYTSGNGSGRIVVMRQGSAVNADPVDLVSYSANTIFGSGSQIGVGNFVVSLANSTNVNVTNLIPNTTYHVAVYEYNGSSRQAFRIPGATGNFTTAPQPTVAATAMTFIFVEGNSLRANWTLGNGARRIVVGRAGSAVTALPVNGIDYVASNVFGSGDNLGGNQYVVYDGTSTFVDLSNLLPNTTYHFAVFEYDGTGSATAYLTSSFLSGSRSTIIAPTVQASNVAFSAVAGTSVTVGWTNGNGTERIVLARQGSAVNADPVNLVTYNGVGAFGSGTQVGTGNYAVYSFSASTAPVTNLLPGTTYHFAVYEYNGSSGRVYLVPGATGSVTTLGPPQVQATTATGAAISTTTMQLNWINGSGNRRLVLMKAGSAVDANPVDNGTYNANSGFGAGTQLGTGNYVVYNATGNTVTVTGLLANTTYHFAVFEFNSFGASSQFLLTNPARGSAITSTTLPLTWLDFTARNEKNAIVLNWSTSSETNTSHFEVQRSAHNNTGDFILMGTVQASGNTVTRHDYSYTDRSVQEGTHYYRIKQFDLDGNFTYSRIISIKYEPAGLIRSFLNPVQQTLFVSLTAFDPNMDTKNEWVLYNMAGVIVARDVISSATIYGNLPYLSAGVYVMEIRVNGKTEKLKLVKY